MKVEVPLRIVLADPPPAIQYALRRGSSELVSVMRSNGGDLTFELSLSLAGRQDDGRPRFTGPFAEGPPSARFVYIRIGTLAGDPSSCWTRAAKIPLSGITWAMVEEVQATPGAVIAASFPGKDKKGDPSCATIRPLANGWSVVRP